MEPSWHQIAPKIDLQIDHKNDHLSDRSGPILIDFGPQHGPNMGPNIVQKSLPKGVGRPKAAKKPPGTHFEPNLSSFWAVSGPNLAPQVAQTSLRSPSGRQEASRKAFRAQLAPILRQGTSQERPSETRAYENSVEIAGQKSFGHRCRPVLAKPLAQWPVVGALAPLEIRPPSRSRLERWPSAAARARSDRSVARTQSVSATSD